MGDRKTAHETEMDPITFQILANAFRSIVDEMGALLQTVAFSLVVSEGRDYSGTICNAEGDLISSGTTDQTSHLGTIPFTVKGMLEWIGAPKEEYFEPGDLVIVNDAYIGGTHNNDVRIIMPVFVEDALIAFVQNSAHWTDIGGHVPGTFDPNARSSQGEGLIIPPLKIVRAGELDRDVTRMILRNVRMAETAYGDLLAQIGGCRLGARRLRELCDRHGQERVLQEMSALICYSERMLRAEFEAIPDGRYSASAYIDRDPGTDSDEQVEVALDVTIEGDSAVYDFSRSAPQARGAINGPRSACISAAIVTTKAIFGHVPMNQGVFNAIEFVLPPGLVISAEYPAPISGMAATTFPAITDLVLGCFIQVVPDRCMAGPAGLVNVVFGGDDTRPGREREFVMYLWLEGGWGARPGGGDGGTSMNIYGSGARNQPIELQERLFPVLYRGYGYEPCSAGAGRHRGGFGVRKTWILRRGEATLSDLGDREKGGPWGYAGGLPAKANSFTYAAGTDEQQNVGMLRTGMKVASGRELSLYHAGGGGYGEPKERPPELVLEDVKDDLVSVDAAEKVYGVAIEVVDPEVLDLRIDWRRTSQLRPGPRP